MDVDQKWRRQIMMMMMMMPHVTVMVPRAANIKHITNFKIRICGKRRESN
jgi:hypothetical protein